MICVVELIGRHVFRATDFNFNGVFLLLGLIAFILILNWSSLKKKVALTSLNTSEVNFCTLTIYTDHHEVKKVSFATKCVLIIMSLIFIYTPFSEYINFPFCYDSVWALIPW